MQQKSKKEKNKNAEYWDCLFCKAVVHAQLESHKKLNKEVLLDQLQSSAWRMIMANVA